MNQIEQISPSHPASSSVHERNNDAIPRLHKNNLISLQSSDGQLFQLKIRAACISRLIKEAIDIDIDSGIEDDGNADINDTNTNTIGSSPQQPPMELYNIQSDCLQNIIKFMNHYAQHPMRPITTPLHGESIDDIISPPWYGEFAAGLQGEMVYQLVAASNYMDVEPLFGLMCLVVSVELKGKTAGGIRILLGIEELTEEEELRARDEHRWLFEGN